MPLPPRWTPSLPTRSSPASSARMAGRGRTSGSTSRTTSTALRPSSPAPTSRRPPPCRPPGIKIMPTNKLKRVSPHLLGHFATFESRTGLIRLNMRTSMRRLAWRWLMESADGARRVLDVIGSCAALLVLSPLLLLVGALIRLDGGPALFAHTSVGRHGREFKMFKFRSMRVDADKLLASLLAANKHWTGVTFKIKDNPRAT